MQANREHTTKDANQSLPALNLPEERAGEPTEDTQMTDHSSSTSFLGGESTIEQNLDANDMHSLPLAHEGLPLIAWPTAATTHVGRPTTGSSSATEDSKAAQPNTPENPVITLDDATIDPALSEEKPTSRQDMELTTMGSLSPGRWLSDEPINQLLTAITALGSMENKTTFGAVSSFHANPSPNEKTVQKYINQMVSADLNLLLPINGMEHWQLAVVYPLERRVDIYESLNNPVYEPFALQAINSFLARYFPGSDLAAWDRVAMAGPSQHNSFDCGIMTVVTAFYLVLGRHTPKGLDGGLWRSALHCLLQVFDAKSGAQEASSRLERYLLARFPPLCKPEDLAELLVFDAMLEDREYHSDLAIWEQDATLKIDKINELLRSTGSIATSVKLAEEPFQIMSTFKTRLLADLAAALPQYVAGNTEQDELEKATKALAEARLAFRQDLELWKQLHTRGRYDRLTSQGLIYVNASLKENKRLATAVKVYQGVCAILDAIDIARKKHSDDVFKLEGERKELVTRRIGLKKLMMAGGASRHLKRKNGWEMN